MPFGNERAFSSAITHAITNDGRAETKITERAIVIMRDADALPRQVINRLGGNGFDGQKSKRNLKGGCHLGTVGMNGFSIAESERHMAAMRYNERKLES